MNTIAQINHFILEIKRLHLNDNCILMQFTVEEMTKLWNGVGGEKQSKFTRKILSWLGRNYLPTFFIHDLEFAFGGTEEQFAQANIRLRKNLQIMVSNLYKKYDIRYWFRQPICHLVQYLCDNYGFENWNLH